MNKKFRFGYVISLVGIISTITTIVVGYKYRDKLVNFITAAQLKINGGIKFSEDNDIGDLEYLSKYLFKQENTEILKDYTINDKEKTNRLNGKMPDGRDCIWIVNSSDGYDPPMHTGLEPGWHWSGSDAKGWKYVASHSNIFAKEAGENVATDKVVGLCKIDGRYYQFDSEGILVGAYKGYTSESDCDQKMIVYSMTFDSATSDQRAPQFRVHVDPLYWSQYGTGRWYLKTAGPNDEKWLRGYSYVGSHEGSNHRKFISGNGGKTRDLLAEVSGKKSSSSGSFNMYDQLSPHWFYGKVDIYDPATGEKTDTDYAAIAPVVMIQYQKDHKWYMQDIDGYAIEVKGSEWWTKARDNGSQTGSVPGVYADCAHILLNFDMYTQEGTGNKKKDIAIKVTEDWDIGDEHAHPFLGNKDDPSTLRGGFVKDVKDHFLNLEEGYHAYPWGYLAIGEDGYTYVYDWNNQPFYAGRGTFAYYGEYSQGHLEYTHSPLMFFTDGQGRLGITRDAQVYTNPNIGGGTGPGTGGSGGGGGSQVSTPSIATQSETNENGEEDSDIVDTQVLSEIDILSKVVGKKVVAIYKFESSQIEYTYRTTFIVFSTDRRDTCLLGDIESSTAITEGERTKLITYLRNLNS